MLSVLLLLALLLLNSLFFFLFIALPIFGLLPFPLFLGLLESLLGSLVLEDLEPSL